MKGKKVGVRKQLLRKNSDEQSEFNENRLMPFQIEGQCISQICQNDRSYYQLHQECPQTNPYPYEPSFEMKPTQKKQQPISQQKPSTEFPAKITMNGNCYKKVTETKEQKHTKKGIQEMEVVCQKCCVNQVIPGTSTKFYCFSCQTLNRCQPKYKYFKCGQCKAKVCYPWGYSEHIKCTNCQTINFVPSL